MKKINKNNSIEELGGIELDKPELLTTAGSLDELERVIRAGADAVTIGELRWGMRLPGEFSLAELKQAIPYAHQAGVKVYVPVNRLMTNEQLEQLPDYLRELVELKADAIIFGDPAVLIALKEQNLSIPLHWNTEMTSTNYATAEYWAKHGAVRAIAARELNLEEIHEFKRNSNLELQVQVHGITNIYHSERRLLHSYTEHIAKGISSFGPEQGFYLIEHERPELQLPIYEDANGTHVMSPDDICMLEALDELLEEPIDSLKVEGLLKTPEYNETVVRCYRQAIDAYCDDPQNYRCNPEWLEAINELQDPNRELSFGFFFKEQVY